MYTTRSIEEANKTTADIKAPLLNSKGEIIFLYPDLKDLGAIEKSPDDFLSKETGLDVLGNKTGVITSSYSLKTK